jgi:hypothetical protein
LNSTPIFVKTYDLLVWLTQALTRFPKDQRFRLAGRIETCAFRFHELILKASRVSNRRPLLEEADLELEKLRAYLRMALDLKCLNFKQYEHACRLVDETGRLLGGWLKSLTGFANEDQPNNGIPGGQ